MCQWLMTAALSELLNKVEFTLNCTESKWVALSATLSAPRAKWHWIFLASPSLPGSRKFWESSVAKACVTVSLTVGTCAHLRVFTCALTHLCVCFPLRAISEGQIWASEFDTKRACFVFVKSNFVANCTCKNFALKWLSCRGRAVAGFSGVGEKSRERDLKFVEIVLGFYNEKLSNLPATVAGK